MSIIVLSLRRQHGGLKDNTIIDMAAAKTTQLFLLMLLMVCLLIVRIFVLSLWPPCCHGRVRPKHVDE
jgi:hypothetical protein